MVNINSLLYCIIKIEKSRKMFSKCIPHFFILSPYSFSFLFNRKKYLEQTYLSSQNYLLKSIPKLILYEFQKFQKIINEFQFAQATMTSGSSFRYKKGINKVYMVHRPTLIFILRRSKNKMLLFTLIFKISSKMQKVFLRKTKQLNDKCTKYEI